MDNNTIQIDPNVLVLEYSGEQQCFHIGTVREMVEGNVQSLIRGRPNSYIPLGYSTDYDALDELRKKLEVHIPGQTPLFDPKRVDKIIGRAPH